MQDEYLMNGTGSFSKAVKITVWGGGGGGGHVLGFKIILPECDCSSLLLCWRLLVQNIMSGT